jgi:hypothetical protein
MNPKIFSTLMSRSNNAACGQNLYHSKMAFEERSLATPGIEDFKLHYGLLSTIRNKALRYKLFFLKALTKRLWKLTIKTKRLSLLKSLSFLNFNY